MATSNRFGLVGTFVCFTLGFSVWACSGSDSESAFEQPQQNTSSGSTDPNGQLGSSGVIGSSSSGGSSGSVGACTAAAPPAGFAPQFKPPVQANACSDQEIDDYYTACFTQPYDEARCKGYESAHAACTSCIATPETAAALGPIVLHRNASYYTVNVAGCLGLAQNDLTAGSCAAQYSAAIECKKVSCDSCFTGSPNDYSNFSTCKRNSNVAACETLTDNASTKCGAIQSGPTARCFGTSSETNFQVYKRIAPMFCRVGASTNDGG